VKLIPLRKSSQLKRPSILLVAISGRGLAAAARRAGFVPLVLDFFADEDTEDIADECVKFTGPIGRGIGSKELLDGLSRLTAQAPSPVLGCIAGSGFEDRAELLSKIAEHWALLGNDAETVARIKSIEFFDTLDHLGLPHPRTQTEPPRGEGWLTKRRGAAGGSHIAPYVPRSSISASGYFQERVKGLAVSALFVGDGSGACVLGFSEQWANPTPTSPFRYGGAARPASISAKLQDEMTASVLKTSAAFKLKGLGSADFIIDEGTGAALFLEINPRPGATLDIFDEEIQPLLKLHLDAILDGRLPTAPLALEDAMASALLYAPERLTIAEHMVWPDWVADRPKPRESIDKNRPICTVLARSEIQAPAKRLVAERMKQILAGLRPKNRGGA
jgi:predicted ATP-grasp superfamily ATP-dependent carboligase